MTVHKSASCVISDSWIPVYKKSDGVNNQRYDISDLFIFNSADLAKTQVNIQDCTVFINTTGAICTIVQMACSLPGSNVRGIMLKLSSHEKPQYDQFINKIIV